MSADANQGQRNSLNESFSYDDWMFLMLDNLPTLAECVQTIVNYAPRYGSNIQKDHIHQFSIRLLELWHLGVT